MNYTRQIKMYPSSALDTEYPDMIQSLCATISITKTAKACNSTATSYSISPADLPRRSWTCRLSVSLPAAVNATIYLKMYFLILIAWCPHAESEFLSMASIITQMCCLKKLSYLKYALLQSDFSMFLCFIQHQIISSCYNMLYTA